MTPRVHNLTSYIGALAALPLAMTAQVGVSGLSALPTEAVLGVVLWELHFARRALESGFVHRYSKPAFPWADALVEYAYYWGFGVWIGWSLSASPASTASNWALAGWVLLWLLAEVGNLASHIALRGLREAGGSDKPIPQGWLFRLVSCPHYAFEITAWIAFFAVTRTLASGCFLALVSAILAYWAWQRHSAYVARFDGKAQALYPRERKALLPWVF